jgi:hypothetical protein
MSIICLLGFLATCERSMQQHLKALDPGQKALALVLELERNWHIRGFRVLSRSELLVLLALYGVVERSSRGKSASVYTDRHEIKGISKDRGGLLTL